MKTLSYIFLLATLIATTSCKKDRVALDKKIVGKWKLAETYNGYSMGGDFKWHSADEQSTEIISFDNNNQYQRHQFANNTLFKSCTGNYNLTTTNLSINNTCQTVTEDYLIRELTSNNLILEINVREGIVKYKYVLTQ